MHAHTHTHTYACTYHTYSHTYIHIYIHAHVCEWTISRTRNFRHRSSEVHAFVHAYVCTYVLIELYIRTFVRTYMYVYMQTETDNRAETHRRVHEFVVLALFMCVRTCLSVRHALRGAGTKTPSVRHPQNKGSSRSTSMQVVSNEKTQLSGELSTIQDCREKKPLFRARNSMSFSSAVGLACFHVETAPGGQPRPSPVQLRCVEEGQKLAWKAQSPKEIS